MYRAKVSMQSSMFHVDMTLIHCTADDISNDEESKFGIGQSCLILNVRAAIQCSLQVHPW